MTPWGILMQIPKKVTLNLFFNLISIIREGRVQNRIFRKIESHKRNKKGFLMHNNTKTAMLVGIA